jgi:deoxyribonuclease-4
MPRFGAHLSVAPYAPPATGRRTKTAPKPATVSGPVTALLRAADLGCDTVQFFLRPNRQWHAAELTDADVTAFRAAFAASAETGRAIRPVVSHASYLINLAGPPGERPAGGDSPGSGAVRDVRRLSIEALIDELRRAAMLGVPYVVLHPGNHLGDGEELGLRRTVEALDEVLNTVGDPSVSLLLETTAGQGTCVGHRLEHLAWILAHSAHADRLAVCADTCHLFAAGYDLRTAEGYEATVREIDRTVGLARLRLWHLNDCLRECGSGVDRHTHIGRGRIGRAGFRRLVTDLRFADCPMILETPKEDDAGRAMDPVNLRTLRRLMIPR